MAITREDMVVQSIQDHLREHLYGTYSYPENRVEIIEGYSSDLFDERFGDDALSKTYVAVAFQFDNGGEPMELGSSLTAYLHTIDFFVFGHTPTWGRNVAQLVKGIFHTESGTIPLRDYSQPGLPKPVIDALIVEEASTERVNERDARPYQQNAWITRLRVTDEVVASL